MWCVECKLALFGRREGVSGGRGLVGGGVSEGRGLVEGGG